MNERTKALIQELSAATRDACARTNVDHERRFYAAVGACVDAALTEQCEAPSEEESSSSANDNASTQS